MNAYKDAWIIITHLLLISWSSNKLVEDLRLETKLLSLSFFSDFVLLQNHLIFSSFVFRSFFQQVTNLWAAGISSSSSFGKKITENFSLEEKNS